MPITTTKRQGLNASAAIKVPCVAATTANITLSGEQTIDGVACVSNDRVLVKNQTTASENGIYEVDTSAWSRASDWDGSYDVKKGTLVSVTGGTANSDTMWRVSTSGTITVGTTSVSFESAMYSDSTDVAFLQTGTGAVSRTVQGRLRESLSVKDFGATGDGVTDDTAAIQLALNAGSSSNLSVHFPAGTYVVTDTLWPTPEGSTSKSAVLFGDGGGYVTASAQTIIDGSSITNKPIINLQRVRGSRISGMRIEGPNGTFAAVSVELMDWDYDWVGSNRATRYSPQCAIAIDAGVGSTPADGGYSGFTYQASSGGSYQIQFEDVVVDGHVVGYMIGPDTSANASDIHWRSCQIINVREGIAAGHSQCRGLHFYDGSIGYFRSAYDGIVYGNQQGSPPIFYGTQFGPGFQIYNFTSVYGTTNCVGIRAESVHRIGYAGGSTTGGNPIVFMGCDFAFLNTTVYGKTTNLVLESLSQPVTFIGCQLKYDGASDLPAGMWVRSPHVVFEGCTIQIPNRFDVFVGDLYSWQYPTVIKNTRILDGTSYVLVGAEGMAYSLSGRVTEHPSGTHAIKRYRSNQYMYVRQTTVDDGFTSNGVATSGPTYTFSSTQLTFSTTSTTNQYIMVGDYLFWTMNAVGSSSTQHLGPTLKVTAVSGADITCSLLSPRDYYDETYAPTYILIAVRAWAPGQALTGDTHTNTTLDNVSPTTILQNGDWLKASADLGAGVRVASGSGTTTITLSKASTGTSTGVSLYWDRLHTITSTAAF